MKKEVAIPKGGDVSVSALDMKIKGPKGELLKSFENPMFNSVVTIEKNGETLVVSSESERRQIKAIVGAIVAHARNMITGVTKGYEYTMKTHYSHFPRNVEVTASKDAVVVKGTDIEEVGQTCRNIEAICKISDRDGRVFNDGIYVTEKKLQTGEKL